MGQALCGALGRAASKTQQPPPGFGRDDHREEGITSVKDESTGAPWGALTQPRGAGPLVGTRRGRSSWDTGEAGCTGTPTAVPSAGGGNRQASTQTLLVLKGVLFHDPAKVSPWQPGCS